VLGSAQNLGHQLTEYPLIVSRFASKLWSGHDRAQSVFSRKLTMSATIGYQEAFPIPLRHPFQSPYFVDLLTNFRFQRSRGWWISCYNDPLAQNLTYMLRR
jgi:hypothetical protein